MIEVGADEPTDGISAPDAGTAHDVGTAGADGGYGADGAAATRACGCSTADAALAPGWLVLLGGLVFLLRRR